MGSLIKILPQNTFVRGVLTLASGTVGAQAILIASAPLLTRLYSPDEFGILSVFLSMLGLVGGIAALRFELAIPLPEDDRNAAALSVTGAVVVVLFSLALFALVTSYSESLANQFNAPILAPYLWLLPVTFFANGLFLLLNMLCVRHERFGDMAKAKVLQSAITVVVQVAGFSLGGAALIIGRVLGHVAAAIQLVRGIGLDYSVTVRTLKLYDLWRVAINYRTFPLISTWSALASSIGSSITPLMFAAFFGLEMAGYFAMTMMVMVVPMSIIGVAVQNAFYRKAVDAHRTGRLAELILAVQSRLVLATLPFFALSAFVLPDAFVLMFGEAWRVSGTFAVWILPWMLFQLTVTPCTGIFPIVGRLGLALLLDLSLAAAPVLAFSVALWLRGDALFAVQLLSAIASLVYLARISIAYCLAGGQALTGVAVVLRGLMIAAIGVLPAFVVPNVWSGKPVLALLFAISCGALLAAVAIRWAWKRLPEIDIGPYEQGAGSQPAGIAN